MRFFICLFCFFTNLNFLFAQYYAIQNFDVRDGLGQSEVYAIEQDSLGFLWLGTRGGGLSKFDGERFINFTKHDGLKSNFIQSIEKIGPSDFLIATDKGINRLSADGITAWRLC